MYKYHILMKHLFADFYLNIGWGDPLYPDTRALGALALWEVGYQLSVEQQFLAVVAAPRRVALALRPPVFHQAFCAMVARPSSAKRFALDLCILFFLILLKVENTITCVFKWKIPKSWGSEWKISRIPRKSRSLINFGYKYTRGWSNWDRSNWDKIDLIGRW